MTQTLSREFLTFLRNKVPVAKVVRALNEPIKICEGYERFLCPKCGDFNTAIHPRENLGQCFRCNQRFNPIDMVMMARSMPFRHAAMVVWRIHNGETSNLKKLCVDEILRKVRP